MTKRTPFWDRVDKSAGCWQWTGCTSRGGYGVVKVGQKTDYVHRVAYRLTHGSIPEGLVIDHLCRNRACVNPAHLETVTLAENTRRGIRGYGALRTRCNHGHDITNPKNVITNRAGGRRCRTCKRSFDTHRRQSHAGAWLSCPSCGAENEETRTYRNGEDDA